ncbi:MAG: Lipid flippase MurJ, partial [Acidobacteriota bacterium]
GMILRAGFLGMLVNIAGDLLLPRWMGVAGIALSSTLAHVVFMAVLVILLYWREPRLFRSVTA